MWHERVRRLEKEEPQNIGAKYHERLDRLDFIKQISKTLDNLTCRFASAHDLRPLARI